MTDNKQVGRLAFRVEGDWWVSYYALPETMDGALELGRVRMAVVREPFQKDLFMTLMRAAVSDILVDQHGVRPIWPEPHGRPAPEHERAGKA
jgi:hypothetical protein